MTKSLIVYLIKGWLTDRLIQYSTLTLRVKTLPLISFVCSRNLSEFGTEFTSVALYFFSGMNLAAKILSFSLIGMLEKSFSTLS